MIKLDSINKKFKGFSLKDITLDVADGEYFVLLGKSGSGKSLILELIAGLQTPLSGKVSIGGKDAARLPIQKRKVGFVFQNHSLFPHMTVKANIYFPLKRSEQHMLNENILKVIDLLNITLLLDRYPETLSLGESHRVALARTLVTNPSCLLLDEPLSSLDAQSKYEIRSLLRKINKGLVYFGEENKNKPITIIHVTHDYEEALALATKIAVIEDGTITQEGLPEDVFRHPKSKFIAKFVGIKNFYRGTVSPADDDGICAFTLAKSKDRPIVFYIPPPEIPVSDEHSIIIRSEDVILSLDSFESSARNNFRGVVSDIENMVNGVEVTLEIGGVEISSLITYGSFKKMNLKLKQVVYANFKASSVRFP